jgi:large subunit ribosomal protein L15
MAEEKKTAAAKKPAATQEKSNLLKLHHLRPAPGAKKDRTRFGRGEGSKGKTAGRGTKGTKARYQVRPGFEGGGVRLVMRTPKLRGFKNPFKIEYQVVNIETLVELYPQGGEATVKLDVKVDKVSESAKAKIIAAGGSVTE